MVNFKCINIYQTGAASLAEWSMNAETIDSGYVWFLLFADS